MKKLLGSTLALALLFPYSQANAELLKNFKLGGQIDVQATSANNVTDFATRQANNGGNTRNDRIGDAQTRIMLTGGWDWADDVHAKMTLRKNNRVYGAASEDLNTAQTNIVIDQSFIKVDKLADAVDMTLGRQFYGDSGDLVTYFGPSDKAQYGLAVSALDAGRFDWGNDSMGLTAIVGQTVGTGLGVSTGNTDLRGIIASCKGHENMKGSLYLWNRVTHGTGASGAPPTESSQGGKNDNLYVVGVKGKFTQEGLMVAAEAAKNFGDNRRASKEAAGDAHAMRYTGYAVKLDASYKAELGGMGAVTPWLHWGYGSGDGSSIDNKNEAFSAISPDYRPGSIYGRFAVAAGGASLGSNVSGATIASNSLSNRNIMGIGAKITPEAVNKLTAGLSFWKLQFARGNDPVTSGNKNIGTELDLDATWKHNDNISLMAGVGTFQPGGAIAELVQSKNINNASANSQRPLNPATLAFFDVRVKFGEN